MILFALAFLGGVLTILSPCILPVLPFVFARADRPFVTSGLPMLAGMALTFAAIATLAAVAGGWAVEANRYGRVAAIALLGLFGIALLLPRFADRIMQPIVALGGRLSQSADAASGGFVPSLLLGIATGLLWAPCAGPVLGLILTGAALQGANVQTTVLLLAYAAGAATSLALALLVGGRVFAAMKRSLGAGEWIRRGLGVAVLAAVAAIALGLDTGFLTRVSLASTAALEQRLLDKLNPPTSAMSMSMSDGAAAGPTMSGPTMAGPTMTDAGTAMSDAAGMTGAATTMRAKPLASAQDASELNALAGAVTWLNSEPLTAEKLKGKVVLIDFWTYSCINCLRTLPYVRAWAQKYKDQGLVVIGVHTPEFAFEKNVGNVKKAVSDLGIGYPVAIDSNYAIWRAFDNHYWPAHYFVDAQGRVRDHHFGEGDYEGSERIIQSLLAEAGKSAVAPGLVTVNATGAQAAAGASGVLSPETYVGYARAENFVSPGGAVRDARHAYTPGTPRLNEWSLAGEWTIAGERAVLNRKNGAIVYRFHARDVHLVLGAATGAGPIRFRVTIDGAAPGASHGADIDGDGRGTVRDQRLYQLLRQDGAIQDRTVEIQFLDPGVEAYAFTFG